MRVLIMYPLFEDKISILKKNYETDIISHTPTKDDLYSYLRKYDAIISLLSHKFTEDMFEGEIKTKIIVNYAVGYDNIPLNICKEKNIVVCNTPDVLTRASAELAFALLISVSRNFYRGENLVRTKEWKGWAPDLLLGFQLNKMEIGIIGAGRIGTEMMRICNGFGMKVYYYSRTKKEDCSLFAEYKELDQLIKESDAISLHIPLNEETHHLLSRDRIFSMKKNAILINTARGDVVDEDALIDALEKKHLWGAGLDVYHNEPQVNERLLKLDNVILQPHTGSATFNARHKMAEMAVRSIMDFFDNKEPLNRVV